MLGDRPACDYIFDTLNEVDTIDEKYVYCSDEAILPYMEPYKELKFLKRDPYLDGYFVKGLEIIDRFIKDVDADIYVLTHVTEPFTTVESFKLALSWLLAIVYFFPVPQGVDQDGIFTAFVFVYVSRQTCLVSEGAR